MVNNTDTYWEANGVSLHTYAQSIETLSGIGLPSFRGDNVVVPLFPGERYVPKVMAANKITLGMWLRGVDPTAGPGVTATTKAQYQKNYNDLIRLLWCGGKQFQLRKRFYDTSSGSVISAVAMAEYAGGLEPKMMSNSGAKFTVDLNLADPLFYNDVQGSQNLVNGLNSVTVPGNAPTLNCLVTVNGARNNVTVRNKTNGIEFTTPENLPVGDRVEINPQTYGATYYPASLASYDVSPRIIHTGGPQWFQLEPGVNSIEIVATSGTGIISLQFRGAWV